MDDSSTRVLERPELDDNDTRIVADKEAGPGSSASGPAGKGKKEIPLPLRAAWGIVRAGVIATSLLVIAQSVAGLVDNAWISWIAALLLGIAVPVGLLFWIRKLLKQRAPKLKIKIPLLNWALGWNLILFLILWLSQPGVLTQAIGVQGSALAGTMARATTADDFLPVSLHWTADTFCSVTGYLEDRVFGPELVAERVALAQRALGSPLLDGQAENTGSSEKGAGTLPAGPADSSLPGVPVSPESDPFASGGFSGSSNTSGTASTSTGSGPSTGSGGTAGSLSDAGPPSSGTFSLQTGAVGSSSQNATAGLGAGAGVSGLPAPLPEDAAAYGSLGALPPVVEIPFYLSGNLVLVDVVLERRFPVRLQLDTGATYSTLDSVALHRFGLTPSANAPTISAETDRGPRQESLTVASSLALGGLELSGVSILRCEDCGGADYQGILGANVLNNFTMTPDRERGVITLEDRRARNDQRLDISPFLTLEARPEASSAPLQPFVVTAVSRAPRVVQRLFGKLNLYAGDRKVVGSQDVKFPSLAPGQRASVRVEVPRQPAYAYYKVEIAEAQW